MHIKRIIELVHIRLEKPAHKVYAKNGFINTWILHQIIMYSNKVILVAG